MTGQPAEPPPPVTRQGRQRKPSWSKTAAIATTAITAVGTIASVILVVNLFTRDSTNFSHLEIEANPAVGQGTEWAVPQHLVESLPETAHCDAALLAWLESNAQPLHREFTVRMRNNAAEGPMLALVDFSAVGTSVEDRSTLSVRLICDPSGVIPTQVYYGRLDADQPDHPAEHVQLELDSASVAPTIPVTFNLAPGESGTLPLSLFSRRETTGSMEVTVLSGTERKTVPIPGSEFEIPALLYGGEMYLMTSDQGLVCLQTRRGLFETCSLDELQVELEAAGRQGDRSQTQSSNNTA